VALQLVDPAPVWATVIAAVLTATIAAAFFTSGPVAILASRTGRRLPEAAGGYDHDALQRYVAAADRPSEEHEPSGLTLYRMELHWDIVFVLLYGIGALFVVDGTWGRAASSDRVAWRLSGLGVVLLLVVLDLLEDGLLLLSVGRSPGGELAHPALVRWARFATRGKKTAALLTAAIVVVGFVRAAIS
jgi:hypothetical protein